MGDADRIFLYLLPSVMEKLEKKFDAELKPGTRVVSNSFRFPSRKPIEEIPIDWYKEGRKLVVYEW